MSELKTPVITMPKPVEKQSKAKYLMALRTYDPTIMTIRDVKYDDSGNVISFLISREPD